MAAVIKETVRGYRYLNDYLSDPRSADFPLVGSPWPLVLILGAYLGFILNLGPHLMKNRKPFNLKLTLIVYNALQILINGFIFYKAFTLKYGIMELKYWLCDPLDYSTTPHALLVVQIIWLYFILKVIDLLDTIFFVLRKKEKQISFLHIYHHAGMVLGSWIATKYLGSGHMIFVGFINTFVHMLMYTYYLVAIFYPESRKDIWWKKYITQLQMTQFFLVMVHCGQLFFQPNCSIPKFIPMGMTPQYFFMTFMFWDFYRKAYGKNAKKKELDEKCKKEMDTKNN